jgi:hypothetical protein
MFQLLAENQFKCVSFACVSFALQKKPSFCFFSHLIESSLKESGVDGAHGLQAFHGVVPQVEFGRHVLKPGLISKAKGLRPVAFKLRVQQSATCTAPPRRAPRRTSQRVAPQFQRQTCDPASRGSMKSRDKRTDGERRERTTCMTRQNRGWYTTRRRNTVDNNVHDEGNNKKRDGRKTTRLAFGISWMRRFEILETLPRRTSRSG